MKRDEIVSILTESKPELQAKYHITTLGVFGSGARDEMNADSDIDIVVEMPKPDAFDLIGVKQDLEEKFHIKVDIIHKRKRMNEFLRKRIEKEAIYV